MFLYSSHALNVIHEKNMHTPQLLKRKLIDGSIYTLLCNTCIVFGDFNGVT